MATSDQIDDLKSAAAFATGVDHFREHFEEALKHCPAWAALDAEDKLMFLMTAVSTFMLDELEETVPTEAAYRLYRRELRRQLKAMVQAEEADPSDQWDVRKS
jgi:hypothetical protein